MKKSITNNKKIKYTLLSILFSILFIFTALNISNPITVYAYPTADTENDLSTEFEWDPVTRTWVRVDDYGESGVDGVVIPDFDADEIINGTSTTGSVAPAYTYWGGDSHRCGVICYVIDLSTNTMDSSYEPFVLVHDLIDSNNDDWKKLLNAFKFPLRTGDTAYVPLGHIYQVREIQPVVYAGDGWSSNGAAVESALLAEDATYKYQMFKYWAYFGGLSDSQISQLARDISSNKKALAFETVSAQSFFTGSDSMSFQRLYGCGSYFYDFNRIGDISINHDGMIVRCLTTEYGFAKYLNNKLGLSGLPGSTHNWKWFQSTAGSMILEEDEAGLVVPSGNTTIGSITSSEASTITNGYGILITHISLPPIHTFDGTNTPGNTEPPSDDDGTSGECTIKKLYYTQEIASDGTILTEATDYHHFTQSGTTNYISIDTEEDYEIEGWKTSSSDSVFTQKSHYDGISPVKNNGTSSEIITLDETADEKYLYVLYKKTEVNPNPPDPWDFQLKESQITKRVTFLESSGPANTSSLLTHNFSWTAPAPSVTSCQSHGGNGHHLKHSQVINCTWVPGTPASGTPGTPGYVPGTSGYWDHSGCTCCGGHTNACYDTPCTTWKWTDNTTKLGITIDTSSINKAVVSKNWRVTYNATTVNTIGSDDRYYKTNTSTRSGTGANTQSISQFNFITVLFRGQDHLTLADWKNGGPVSYLTNIAYDSSCNFKSANTPQGTRKSGTEYTETFAAKFINRSPDMSTTYKATVGAYGTCLGSTSSYSFNNEYTISGIKVNIQVFWAQGVSPSASGTLPSTQAAGSATFYPYIRMRYDNNTQQDKKVYVLGQNTRTVTFYDYASVGISGGDKELTINSNQWSTHSDAMNNILSKFSGRTLSTTEENRIKSSVLPGGATLSLSVNSSNTRQIVVTTIQAYLTGSGKTQVDVTGGTSTSSLPTDRTQLESIHTSLVSSVSGVASQAYIAQYICTGAKLNSSEMTGAQFVKAGDTFNGNGTAFSVDTKYHFNRYTDSKLNTHVNSPSYSTYTFYTDTMGNIRCSVNNTSPSETSGTIIATKGSNTLTGGNSTIREIANKTGVVLALRKGLVDNEGDDTEAPWATADGKWYNEAFDGVTYLYAVSTIDIGIWDPLERSTVLDPKETPQQTSKGSYFNEFNSSFFRSMINGGPTASVGTFTNKKGNSRTLFLNFGELYESKVFYIPNVTTQDLK